MEKLRKENEQLQGLREEERLKWEGKWSQEETQIVTETKTQEIEGGLKGPKDEHTHMQLARFNGGELADCRDRVRAAGWPPSGTEGDAMLP